MAKVISCKFNPTSEVIIYKQPKEASSIKEFQQIQEERKKEIRAGEVIIVDISIINMAYFYVDNSCFDNHTMPEKPIKWSVVYRSAFEDAKGSHKKIDSKLWGLNGGDVPINYLGMDRHYKNGNDLSFKVLSTASSCYYFGHLQQVLVFTDKPEEAFSFYILPLSNPCISYCYFDNSEKNYQYGDIVKLTVKYHNIQSMVSNPSYTKVYIVEDTPENANLATGNYNAIDIKAIENASVWQSRVTEMQSIDNIRGGAYKERTFYKINALPPLGCYTVVNDVLIDYEKWRKGEHKEKKFSVIALVYTEKDGNIKIEHCRNFIAEPTKDLFKYDTKTISIKDIDIKPDSISSSIKVNADFMSEILSRLEIAKHNMIQYIGDISYNKMEHNRCAFSVITVNNGEQDIEIFNEYKLNKEKDDGTSRFVDLVVGDKEKKKVTITAKFIHPDTKAIEHVRTKKNGHLCEMILNEGKPHNGLQDVFKMGWVVGQWVPSKDPIYRAIQAFKLLGIKHPKFYHPSMASSSPVIAFDTDQDAKGIAVSGQEQQKYETITVAGIQGLTHNDYTIDEDNDSISLNLQYIYNKHIAEDSPIWSWGYAGQLSQGLVDHDFWRFNYFWLSDNMAQTFFVPVSTCRYPNQIAKIRVFPDIEWKMSLSVGATLPDTYSYTNMPSGDINKRHHDKALKSVRSRTQLNTSPLPVSFDLKVKATTNKVDSVELAAGYEAKIKGILSKLISIKDTVDELCNTKQAKASSLASLVKARTPITLKIDYPVIAISGSWKYGQDINQPNKAAMQGSLSFGFNPLIKGEGAIDLLACLEIYPVAKALIKAADLVLASVKGEMWFDLYAYGAVNLNADIFFNKKDIADIQIDTVIGLGVRLGIKVELKTKKLTFRGDNTEDMTIGAEISGKGETTLKIKGKRGIDHKGVFTELSVDFGGVQIFVTAKGKVEDFKFGEEAEVFTLIDPKPDIFKERIYLIGHE